jgi:hypothetical protein
MVLQGWTSPLQPGRVGAGRRRLHGPVVCRLGKFLPSHPDPISLATTPRSSRAPQREVVTERGDWHPACSWKVTRTDVSDESSTETATWRRHTHLRVLLQRDRAGRQAAGDPEPAKLPLRVLSAAPGRRQRQGALAAAAPVEMIPAPAEDADTRRLIRARLVASRPIPACRPHPVGRYDAVCMPRLSPSHRRWTALHPVSVLRAATLSPARDVRSDLGAGATSAVFLAVIMHARGGATHR